MNFTGYDLFAGTGFALNEDVAAAIRHQTDTGGDCAYGATAADERFSGTAYVCWFFREKQGCAFDVLECGGYMTGSRFHEGDGRRNGGVRLENPDGAAALQRFEQVECAVRITGVTQLNNDHGRLFRPGFFGLDDWTG